MFFFLKPSPSFIRTFLEVQAKLTLTYSEVGATAGTPPLGYVVDHTRIKIGSGRADFTAAKNALRKWEQFCLGWVEPYPHDTAIEPGQVVGVSARFCGMWSLNACRIVYVRDEPRKFGFAYGTLPDHIESGEERFTVEWQEEDDAVWYDILAFSRPRHLLARVGYPFVRRLQKRFASDSAAAMKRAVEDEERQGRIDVLCRETVARLRDAAGKREPIVIAVAHYLDEGWKLELSPFEMWDYFCISSPSLVEQAGYTEQEADRIIRIFSTVSHQRFGDGRPLPPDWPWFEKDAD